ncbi:hypothetical protein IGI37_000516 [Enterococcus sp. AZ194]|uniref:hypothetical protein n=1 Tax=Enterococcus sp. AZ194 TaxID=2774629 RepID=UPI003F2832D6
MNPIETYLTEHFELETVDPDEITGSFLKYELADLDNYTEHLYTEEEISEHLCIYWIKYNEASKEYFSETLSHYIPMKKTDGSLALAVLWLNIGEFAYVTSNSTK